MASRAWGEPWSSKSPACRATPPSPHPMALVPFAQPLEPTGWALRLELASTGTPTGALDHLLRPRLADLALRTPELPAP